MKPILTVAEMNAIDEAAPVSHDVLVERAGRAVFRHSKQMMQGLYGRRVVVIVGKGNNGADGRVAARMLRNAGVGVRLVEAGTVTDVTEADLVIDAAYGTGFHGTYDAPSTHGAPVLAVDIPSGVNGDTGEARARAVRADRTVTFAALKPGLLFASGPSRVGRLFVEDIGLDTTSARMWLMEEKDFTQLPLQARDTHKWKTAVAVVAGSPGMTGAAMLCVQGAQRSGASMVRLMIPGESDLPSSDAVAEPLPGGDWASTVLNAAERVGALVIGPGLGRSDEAVSNVLAVVEKLDVPVVLDADALFAVATKKAQAMLRSREAPTILTPHDGEFQLMTGVCPSPRRWEDANQLAQETGSVVLLKGPATVIADGTDRIYVANSGDQRLATAGSGDVLTGIVGSFIAQGADAKLAAALAAHTHGAAAKLGKRHGFTASDLPGLVSRWITEVRERTRA